MDSRPGTVGSTDAVVFFDGVCNLCNGTVDFLVRRDKHRRLRYSPLQSDFAQEQLGQQLDELDLSTVVVLWQGQVYTKSRAVILLARMLPFPYSALAVFRVLPTFVLDFFYGLVARNRYRLFGKRETCRLPSPEEKDLFIEE